MSWQEWEAVSDRAGWGNVPVLTLVMEMVFLPTDPVFVLQSLFKKNVYQVTEIKQMPMLNILKQEFAQG